MSCSYGCSTLLKNIHGIYVNLYKTITQHNDIDLDKLIILLSN